MKLHIWGTRIFHQELLLLSCAVDLVSPGLSHLRLHRDFIEQFGFVREKIKVHTNLFRRTPGYVPEAKPEVISC